MNFIKKAILTFLVAGFPCLMPQAQNVALKTNILPDIALSPNLGIEIGLAPKWSLDITGEINAWTVNGHKWKHLLGQPEARYWLCERFAGHFFGLHALGGIYNVDDIQPFCLDFKKNHDLRYQGWAIGGGIAYGYAWILGKHWNLEAEIGVGYVYTKYDICQGKCIKIAKDKTHNYFGPTKAALNFVYIF